jgi:hypothetical protein
MPPAFDNLCIIAYIHASGAKMKCLRHFKLVKLPLATTRRPPKIASLRDLTFSIPDKLFHTKAKMPEA